MIIEVIESGRYYTTQSDFGWHLWKVTGEEEDEMVFSNNAQGIVLSNYVELRVPSC